jgi:hypothetical protein
MALNETARTLLNTIFRTTNQPQALSICMALADSLEENGHSASAVFRHVFAGIDTAVPTAQLIRRALRQLRACSIVGTAPDPLHPLIILPQRTWPKGNSRRPTYHISLSEITREGKTVPWQQLPDDILLHMGLSRLTRLWEYSQGLKNPVRRAERLATQWTHKTRSRRQIMAEVQSLSMPDLCRFFYVLGSGYATPKPLGWQLLDLLRNMEANRSPSPEVPPEA